MPQCKSCRCIKGLDDYTTGLRLFKTCFLAVITKKRTDRLPTKHGKRYIAENAICVNWQPILYNVKTLYYDIYPIFVV